MARPGFTTALRIYEPLAALPAAERTRWQSYAASRVVGPNTADPLTDPLSDVVAAPALDTATAARSEHAGGLAMLVRPRLEIPEEHALVQEVDGLPYICPLDTQRRIWEALADFRDGLSDVVADAFIPRQMADDAAERFGAWRAGVEPEGLRPPHVLTATWHVPLQWFLLVDAADRRLVLGDGPADPARSLTYATTMTAARRRAARTLALLERTIPEAPTVRGLETVGRWLEEFHPYSRVELDYGDLVTILSDAALRDDTSVADLAAGLSALRSGDGAGAAASYERVVGRWRPVQARETAS